jgi:hypothetical protein
MVDRETIRRLCDSVRRYLREGVIVENAVPDLRRASVEYCPDLLELADRVAERLALERVCRRILPSSAFTATSTRI